MARRSVLALLAACSLVALGGRSAFGAGTGTTTSAPRPAGAQTPADFWLATPEGGVYAFGRAAPLGGASSPAAPIVGISPTPDKKGYWLVGADGGVLTFGDASFKGSAGSMHLYQPVVGMTPTSDGGGYWLVAKDGGVFTYGDAGFFGSIGGHDLNQPVVAMASTPDGRGYWQVASDGGVFTYGDARFFGSTADQKLSSPVVALTPTGDGAGYWLLGGDGSVYNFGDAGAYGSSPATPEPAQRLVPSTDGRGYWVIDQNGTSYPLGDASGAPPTTGVLLHPSTPGDAAVTFAFAQLGKPYIWGGNGPNGYDCSGLALASWSNGAGTSFARVANDQYHTAGTSEPYSALVAGDLVFWGNNTSDWTSVYHTAIYVGGGRIVESTGDHVQLNNLTQWGVSDLMPHGMRP